MNREQAFLLGAIAISAIVSLLIILPFLEFVLGAIIVAYVLHPFHRQLRAYVGERTSAVLLIVASMLVMFIPVFYISMVIIRDLSRFAGGDTDLEVAEIEDIVRRTTGQDLEMSVYVTSVGDELLDVLFGNVTEVVSIGVFLSIGAALLVFLVYYLLKDGPAFVDWLIRVTPIADVVCQRVIDQIDRTTWGVVVGHIFVAIVQGVVGGIGLAIAGIPNVIFWTVVMIILAFIPLVGAFLVWGPAAGYLVMTGQTEWGLFLLLYGLVVVSLIDNYARPIVIDREAHLNPAIILIGVFGGIYAIGMSGLFIGPIVLSVLVATLIAFDAEYDRMAER